MTDLRSLLATVPQPPYPADHRCQDCRHRRDEHREPLRTDGRCMHLCSCRGWDPLTAEQWAIVSAAQAEGLVA